MFFRLGERTAFERPCHHIGYFTLSPWNRIPAGGETFRTCPDRTWGSPSLLYNGYRILPGVKRPGLGS